jgi:hypothetical protein
LESLLSPPPLLIGGFLPQANLKLVWGFFLFAVLGPKNIEFHVSTLVQAWGLTGVLGYHQ